MRLIFVFGLAAILTTFILPGPAAAERESNSAMYPELQKYIEQRLQEFDRIPGERKADLKRIASYVSNQLNAGQPAKLTFICTHNSRRSHISQIWAAVAASHYGVKGVETYSGGTEATAFNPRAVAAMERAGLRVAATIAGQNPHYAVKFQDSEAPLICFSKVYSESPNPNADFCAVMTCTQADENCPLVAGCSQRVAVPYEDPKVADGTPGEAAKYDERSVQICREMLYLFSQVGQ